MNTINTATNNKQARFDIDDRNQANDEYEAYIDDLADMFAIAGGVKPDPFFNSDTKKGNKRSSEDVLTKLFSLFGDNSNRH